MSPPTGPDDGRPGRWRRPLRAVLLVLLAAWSLLLAAWLTLHWGILNHIEWWRPRIEQRVSEALGVSVQIGRLEARSSRWIPAFSARDVVLRDALGREVLRLPQVFVALSPRSLLALKPRLTQLLIDGGALEVRRDAAGGFTVAGIPLAGSAGADEDTALADWFFSQGEFVWRGASLRWVDEARAVAPLVLEDASLVVRNGPLRHALRFDATPPPALGERFTIVGRFDRPLLARPGALQRWNGSLQADLPRIDLGAWAARFPGLPAGLSPGPSAGLPLAALPAPSAESSTAPASGSSAAAPSDPPAGAMAAAAPPIATGYGAVRAWLDLRAGQARALTLDLALRDVEARLRPEGPPLRWAELAGRLTARRDEQGLELNADGVDLLDAAGARWPKGPLRLALQAPTRGWAIGPVSGGRLQAQHLDLEPLARAAQGLPLPAGARERLASLAPRGRVSDLDLAWGSPDAPGRFRLTGRVDGLELAAGALVDPTHPARPGLDKASGSFEATEAGGHAQVEIRDGALLVPGALPGGRVPVDELDGRIDWTVESPPGQPRTLVFRSQNLRVANADLRGSVDLTWRLAALGNRGQAPGSVGAAAGAAASGGGARGSTGAAPAPASGEATPSIGTSVAPPTPGVASAAAGASAPAPSERPTATGAPRAPADASADGAVATAAPGEAGLDQTLAAEPPAAGGGAGWRLPGQLTLEAHVDSLPATALTRYLPVQLPPALHEYLGRAIRGGRLREVRASVDGDLQRFPFDRPGEGRFRISGRVEDAGFDFLPSEAGAAAHWPALEALSGELVFDRRAMQIRGASARLAGVPLRDVGGGIERLGRDAVLRLDGAAAAPAADMVGFVRRTPIAGWIGGVLDQAELQGPAALQLGLEIPLHEGHRSTVRGRLELLGNQLRLAPGHPRFDDLHGRLQFSEKGFEVADATAQLFGGEVRFAGGTRADGSQRFSGSGTATAAGLREAAELGFVSQLARRLDGEAAYQASLALRRGRPEIEVTSDLVGLGVGLPAPLGKAAATPLPLRYETRLEAPAPAPAGGPRAATPAPAAEQDTLRLQVGELLRVQYRRTLPAEGGARVLRGAIAVGGPLRLPARGVQASVDVDRLDVDAWRPVIDQLKAQAPAPASSAAPPAVGGNDYLPDTVALRTSTLLAFGQTLHAVDATLSQNAGLWSAQVSADRLQGRIEYLPPGADAAGGHPDGLLRARLARLVADSPTQAPGAPAAVPAAADATLRVPALDVVVEALERQGHTLGRLEVQATHPPAAAGARAGDAAAPLDWQLDRLQLGSPDGTLVASGHWRHRSGAPEAARRSELDFTLDVQDAGRLLERFGFAGALAGGKGHVAGTLGWRAAPYAPDLPTLEGAFHIDIKSGRFLKAEPGVARLLGVLSLQTLPRRLLLDFRDVFGEGFVFDALDGDVSVAGGIARSNNLRMRGPQAVVLLDGQASLPQETQDLRVVVVPELDAGTAALAYAVINPVVGLGTFLAQWFLRRPIEAASTREFHVHGTWADPRVERIERSLFAPVPASGAASAPAAGEAPGDTAEPDAAGTPPAPVPDPSALPPIDAPGAAGAAPAASRP